MTQYRDYPLMDCVKQVDQLLQNYKDNVQIYQKWTCEKCGDRVTLNVPNKMHALGHHEDCGAITDIRARGCNYMVIFRRNPWSKV